jgi:hypothetical protein
MSSTIFYDIHALRFPCDVLSREEDVYLLCFLSGDSRTYCYNGQRERRWTTPIIGTYDDVFAHQITWCASEIYWKNTGSSGELSDFQWLTKIRKALDAATILVHPDLDHSGIQVGDMTVQTHRRCSGMTIREAINNAINLRATAHNTGASDWDAFRILGPGSN